MPVTIVSATGAGYIVATRWTQQRRVFRNPRGLKYYYALVTTDSGVQLYKSSDGQTWSLVSTLNTNNSFVASLDIYDDGTQLIVYVTYGYYYPIEVSFPIYYRRLRFPDDQSDPIIGAEQTAVAAAYQGVPVIKRDRNGYVHIAYMIKRKGPKIKGVEYQYAEPYIKGTTTTNPGDAPSWATPVQISSVPDIAFWSHYARICLLAFGGTGDIGGVIFANRDSAGTPILQGRDIISFNGSAYTLGTTTTIDTTLSAADTNLSASFCAVVDTSNYAHLIFDSVTANQAIKSRKASAGNTVESWEASVVVNSTGGGAPRDLTALSINTDKTPNELYGLYLISNTLRYRTSPVDVISWGDETSVTDNTDTISQLNVSEKIYVGSIHVIYRRDVSPYAVRYYELVIVVPVQYFKETLIISDRCVRRAQYLRAFKLDLSVLRDILTSIYKKAPFIGKFVETLIISVSFVRRHSGVRAFREDLSVLSDVFSWRPRRFIFKLVANLSVLTDVFVKRVTHPRKLVQDLSVISAVLRRRVSQIRRWVEDLVVPEEP